MSYVNLLSQDRTPGSGPMQSVDPLLATRTFSARVVGTGKVVAELMFEGSDNEANWEKVTTLSLSGTDSDSDAVSVTSTWPYVRAVVTAISGVGAAVTAQLEAISDEAKAEILSTAGGLFGGKTIVVSKTGNDTAGAASKYAAEFLTVGAALAAAASGDTVVIRPGTYAESLTLKNGVGIFGFPGVTMNPDAGGGTLFTDGGSGVSCLIDGGIDFESALGGDSFASFTGSGVIMIRGRKWVFNNAAATGITKGGSCVVVLDILDQITGRENVVSAAGSGSVTIRGNSVRAVTGPIVAITGGTPSVVVESMQPISTFQLLTDAASAGATRVSIKAPSISGLGGGSNVIDLGGAATGALYTIQVDSLTGVVRNAISGTGELHLNVGKHLSDFNSPPLIAISGKTFYRCDEIASSGNSPAIIFSGAATVHLLSGRILGGATAPAVLFYSSAGLLRLYPGTILTSGGAESIGVDTAITPTVLAMGDIAANKAANVGVTVAVGSLLVDAAVA